MKTNNFIFLIDCGHGGVINGVPQTAGKRSPDWDCGVLYEGESNRRIGELVLDFCRENCISAVNLVPELTDISLGERVRRANKYKNAILISIHSDAFHLESANGWSVFTYYGQTKSDKFADILYKQAKRSRLKLREDWSDGDPDKEANFYILRETVCPAVLVENLFMTNKKDYTVLNSAKGQKKLAGVICRAIKEVVENGL
jgi:N-acetylmuramoyl-L-alanine amidase